MRESRSPQPYFPVSESRRAGVVHLASACVKRCMSDLAWRGLLYVALLPPNSRARVDPSLQHTLLPISTPATTTTALPLKDERYYYSTTAPQCRG